MLALALCSNNTRSTHYCVMGVSISVPMTRPSICSLLNERVSHTRRLPLCFFRHVAYLKTQTWAAQHACLGVVVKAGRRSFTEASDTERLWWILVSHQGRKSEFHGRWECGHYRHIHYSSYSNGNLLVTKMHLTRGVMRRFNGFPSSLGSERRLWRRVRRQHARTRGN